MTRKSLALEPSTLQRLWDQHQLGRIESVRQASRGINNPTFLVNDQYAILYRLRGRKQKEFTASSLRTHITSVGELVAVLWVAACFSLYAKAQRNSDTAEVIRVPRRDSYVQHKPLSHSCGRYQPTLLCGK